MTLCVTARTVQLVELGTITTGNLGGGWSCPYPQHCRVETSGSWEPVATQPKTKW